MSNPALQPVSRLHSHEASLMNSLSEIWISVSMGAGAAIVIFIWHSLWSRKRAQEVLSAWAQGNGFTVLQAQRKTFVPHWRSTSGKGYQFFRVRVLNNEGLVCQAWVRCHDSGGTIPGTVEVIWDEK